MRILIRGLVLLLFFSLTLTLPSLADQRTGAVAKVPFPIVGERISLERQKVEFIVYSTFIEVDGEYHIKNNNPEAVTITMGFPIDRHSLNIEDGEMPILGFSVRTGKKDEDLYFRETSDGDDSRTTNNVFKRWYKWDMEIGAGKTQKVIVHYFIKMDRKKGVPNFTYALKQAKAYSGNIKSTEIIVNMPIACKDLPVTTQKLYQGGAYLYTSFPKPKISRNLLQWKIENMEPREDLEVYFYKNGYPGWEVTCSSEDISGGNVVSNVLDGDPRTYWSTEKDRKIEGSWIEFKPCMFLKGKETRIWEPKIYKIAIIPGNGETLSKFYEYSHLREAEFTIRKVKKGETKVEKQEEEVTNPRKLLDTIIEIYCTPDWTIQEFFHKKEYLDTKQGPARLTIKSIYQGQKYKPLCISEILIFDRKENEIYDEE